MGTDWGIVLLAAGASKRLGKPKQLLLYKGKALLDHAATTAKNSGAKKIIVVLGANADDLVKAIKLPEVCVLKNEDWKEGMASSVRHGLRKLLEIEPAVQAVIFMVCDQPFVTADLLHKLVNRYKKTGRPIIASGYGDIAGIPALFDKSIFAALLSLEGDTGAKKIIKENPTLVEVVNFPLGSIDIDTASDYEELLGKN